MKDGRPALDSLTDIVTNLVGALVVLMVLGALAPAGRADRVRVPLMHQVDKEAVYFFCKGDQILEVNASAAVASLLRAALSESSAAVSGSQPLENGVVARVREGEANGLHVVRVELRAGRTAGWWPARSASRPGTALRGRLDALDHRRQWAFFWVYPDAHASFRQVRDVLRARRVTVGWIPCSDEHPAVLCAKGDPECILYPM